MLYSLGDASSGEGAERKTVASISKALGLLAFSGLLLGAIAPSLHAEVAGAVQAETAERRAGGDGVRTVAGEPDAIAEDLSAFVATLLKQPSPRGGSPHGSSPNGGSPHGASPHGKSPHGKMSASGAGHSRAVPLHAAMPDVSALMSYAADVGLSVPAPSGAAEPGAGEAAVDDKSDSDTSAPIRLAHNDAPAVAPTKAVVSGPMAKMVRPAPGDPWGRYYVGSEICETCHAGLFDEFSLTVMGRSIKSGKVTAQGKMECETCHGPGSGHVNEGGGRGAGHIRSFRKTDPATSVADSNAICLSCHEKGNQTYWPGSTHETRDVACTDCHTVMRRVTPRFQLAKKTVMDTCFQCHKDRRAQSQRTSHMPMREGKVTCASCHNPHGSATEAMLREPTVNETCYTCHADKRGPFLFEHAPVRENCLNCHDPHGTMHPNLLVVMRERLCQRCHTNPHNQPGLGVIGIANSMRYAVGSSCQNCHTNIHGSNSPSGSRWHR